jgi:hypothetical protein
LNLHRGVKFFQVYSSRDFNGPESAQVVGDELHIQQREPTKPKPGHQVHQSDLGGISESGKHAFAKKSPAQGDAVKPAD